MKLLNIDLTNFRCFDSLSVPFDATSNVHIIVGDNGAGKSAILDAIAFGLAPIIRRFGQAPGAPKRGVMDITNSPRVGDRHESTIVSKPYCQVVCQAEFEKQTVEWDAVIWRDKSQQTRKSPRRIVGRKALHDVLDKQIYRLSEPEDGEVPVFAYYGTNRAAIEFRRATTGATTEEDRSGALAYALESTGRFEDAFEWFLLAERDELVQRRDRKSPGLKLPLVEAVRRAIESMLPGYTNPRITTRPLRFLLTQRKPSGVVTDFYAEQLSDGYRTMLALVMDFARRLAQANPHAPDPLACEAMLMIDEVDLHLHPDWQQTIVPDLERTFPNSQLILTTHSPQVLTSVHSRSIRVLRDGDLLESPGGTYGAESKRTLERVMHVSSRPENNDRVRRLAELNELIKDGQFAKAKQLAVELDQEFESNDPAVDEALTEIENRTWEKEVGL